MGERQDVWGLHEREGLWNQTILAYALAFGQLQANDPSKPRTWSLDFQASVHDISSGQLPPPGDLIAQCQHGTWFFLPWHRLYLSMYEKTIRAILADLASPAIEEATVENWSLPYWNYERESARTLPPAFREDQLPDGLGPNPLAQARRFDWVQDGSIPLDVDQVQPSGWWNEPLFSTPVRADSFGGQVTGWNHRPSAATSPGALEITPHASVHNYVGRDMMGFATAGRDPIFWLHHCNIDRIWEVWKKKVPAPAAPAGGEWASLPFNFLDEKGDPASDVSANVVNTATLGYTYEYTGKPDIPDRFLTRGALMGPHEDELATRSLPPRPLGSSSADVTLALAPTTVDIALEQDGEVHTRAERPTDARVQLHLRNLTMDGEPTVSYSVYLEGVDDPDKLAYVGQVPLFGLVESMDDDAEHQLEYTYDATDAVNELRGEDEWSWDRAKVRIQPSNAEVAARVTDPAELVIGSVSFSFQ